MGAINAWATLSPQDKKLALLGIKGLQTPEEPTPSSLGVEPPMSPMSTTMLDLSGGGTPPLPMGGGVSSLLDMSKNPMMGKVNAKQAGAKALSTQTASDTKSGKVNKSTYLSPEEYSGLRDTLMGTPEMADQQKGVDQLQNMFDMNKDLMSKSQVDLSPLMALADSQTGSNLAASYNKPQNSPAMMAQLSDFLQKIQSKKEDMSKQIMAGVKDLKSGSTQDAYINALKDSNTAGFGGNGMTGLSSVRRNALIAGVGEKMGKDKILTQLTQTNNNLNRALSMMTGKTPVTNKNFALLQQDMINAMAPGGAATEGKVNREMVETLAGRMNDLQQKFGDIKDLRKEQPQIFAQLQGLIKQVKNDYAQAAHQNVEGQELNYQNNPDELVREAAKLKADWYRKQFPIEEDAPKKPHDMPVGTELNGMVKTDAGWVAKGSK